MTEDQGGGGASATGNELPAIGGQAKDAPAAPAQDNVPATEDQGGATSSSTDAADGSLKWILPALIAAIVLGVCYSVWRRKKQAREREAALRMQAAQEAQRKNAPPKQPSAPRRSFAD